MEYLTLSQLTGLVKQTLSALDHEFWIAAEIVKFNHHVYSGHCYLELAEKKHDTVIAQIKGNIWAATYSVLREEFKKATNMELGQGMKILMLARVTYHEIYGISLSITAIDPRYTLGEVALKRKETIEKLQKEGIIDRNKKLLLEPVIQKIAVISSQTAAGYGDFMDQMRNNPDGYSFDITFFQAYLQGDMAEKSIVSALTECRQSLKSFDAVVIIRGGGSQIDLLPFDSLSVAREIATMPVPVFTGIGHERDETVADIVAYRRFITPTAVAGFIISRAREFEDGLNKMYRELSLLSLESMENGRLKLRDMSVAFRSRTAEFMRKPMERLKTAEVNLSGAARWTVRSSGETVTLLLSKTGDSGSKFLERTDSFLEKCESKIRLLDPQNVLRRGYSITLFKGNTIKDTSVLNKEDIIETKLYRGKIESSVKTITPGETN